MRLQDISETCQWFFPMRYSMFINNVRAKDTILQERYDARPRQPISAITVLTLSCHTRLGLPNGFLPPITTLQAPSFVPHPPIALSLTPSPSQYVYGQQHTPCYLLNAQFPHILLLPPSQGTSSCGQVPFVLLLKRRVWSSRHRKCIRMTEFQNVILF
jgi:hypothetical protein